MPSPALSPTHCQRPDQVSPETRPRTTYNPPTRRPRPDNAPHTTEPCAVSAPTTPHRQPDRDLPAARPRPAHHPSAPRSRPRRRLVDAQTTPYSRPACAPSTTLPASCSFPLISVTTRTAHPTQLGGGRAKPCRRVVLSGNTRPGRKPRRRHTQGVDRGKAPRATNTSCVTGSLLARVEGLEAILTPHPQLSHPFPSDPRKTLLGHPQRTLGKPSPDSLKGPSENPPQTPSKDPRRALSSGPTGLITRRTAEASNTALSRGGGKGAT